MAGDTENSTHELATWAIGVVVARLTSVSSDCHEEVAGWLDPLPTTKFSHPVSVSITALL